MARQGCGPPRRVRFQQGVEVPRHLRTTDEGKKVEISRLSSHLASVRLASSLLHETQYSHEGDCVSTWHTAPLRAGIQEQPRRRRRHHHHRQLLLLGSPEAASVHPMPSLRLGASLARPHKLVSLKVTSCNSMFTRFSGIEGAIDGRQSMTMTGPMWTCNAPRWRSYTRRPEERGFSPFPSVPSGDWIQSVKSLHPLRPALHRIPQAD